MKSNQLDEKLKLLELETSTFIIDILTVINRARNSGKILEEDIVRLSANLPDLVLKAFDLGSRAVIDDLTEKVRKY